MTDHKSNSSENSVEQNLAKDYVPKSKLGNLPIANQIDDALKEKMDKTQKELEKLKLKLVQSSQSELSTQAVKIEGLNVLAVQLDDVDGKGMRDVLDQLKNKLGSAAIILAVVNGGKVSLIAGVSKDQTGRIKAGDLVNFVAAQVGGKGGGRPEMAQAGGNDPAGLEKALADVPEWIRSQISS